MSDKNNTNSKVQDNKEPDDSNTSSSEQETQLQERSAVNASMSDATFKSTSIALIEKLLQFSTPRLDTKIVNVLLLEGMMDILMGHVTRLDSSKEYDTLEKYTLEQKLDFVKHKRDIQDLEAMKRSYHAMELLSGNTANHLWVQNARFYDIVNQLFKVFLPNSNGNLNHFSRVFQHLVRRHPCDMLDFVIIKDNGFIFFNYMLPYLTESVIMESILNLLFVRDINPETKEDREKSHKRLCELGFLEFIISSIQLNDHPEYSDAAQDFFIRVIEEASYVDNGDIMFESLKSDRGVEIIESLVKQVTDNRPRPKREQTIIIIKLLVKCGLLSPRVSTVSEPVQGPLYSISKRCQQLLEKHIPEFCSVFIKDRQLAKYNKPITTSDMDLLVAIYQILYNTGDKMQMLASIPNAFWKILVNSFFDKSTSNIYHTLFYRIICLTLSIHYEPTLIVLVRKQSLITRLIDTYEDKTKMTDTRGFILLILNQLRLMADANHSELIHRIITVHPRYQMFLPTLRKDTLAQTEPIYKWKLESCPRPPPHIGPSPPIQTTHFSPYSNTIPLMNHLHEMEDTQGIDLGSDFAYCLGFKEEAIKDVHYEDGSTRTPDHEFPMDIIWGV